LCDRGADTYGFVHRTFLEYFCAMEIVHRFEKTRTITFEQLRDDVFGAHWQDETWHEVLKLICGAIDSKFAGVLVEFLITQKIDIRSTKTATGEGEKIQLITSKAVTNLLLAADCLTEIDCSPDILAITKCLSNRLQQEFEQSKFPWDSQAFDNFLKRLFLQLPSEEILGWLKKCTQYNTSAIVKNIAVRSIVKYFSHDPDAIAWINAHTLYQAVANTLASSSFSYQLCIIRKTNDRPSKPPEP
jgi:hypothetical protein